MFIFVINLLFISSGLFVLLVAIDSFLKYQLPKWAEEEFLFFAIKLGTTRATIQGEDVTGIYSNLEKGYIDKETGLKVEDGKEPKSFLRKRYGVEFKLFQKIKELRIVLKEGPDDGDLKARTIMAGSLFEKSSYLGEVFDAETKTDKTPIYWRYRITVKVTKFKKTFSLYEPHVMLDSAVVSAIGDFTRIKTVDELFDITVEGVSGLKLKPENEKLKSEVLAYIVDSLNSNDVGNESMSEKLGLEITAFNLIQIKISDPEVAKVVQARLTTAKRMEAEIVEANTAAQKKVIGSQGDLDASKNAAEAKRIDLEMQNRILEQETGIFSKAFGTSAAFAYVGKHNTGLKVLALGNNTGINVQVTDEELNKRDKKITDKED